MFFRLPTGVFTLYVKDYLAFSFSKIAFNFATISGCSAAKFFFSPISCFNHFVWKVILRGVERGAVFPGTQTEHGSFILLCE